MSGLAAIEDRITANDIGAIFSPCRRWRYLLWRKWDKGHRGTCVFIGLNPSTADEMKDDPTVRRCVNYAKAWSFDSLWMLNIFAFRATNPADMKAQGQNAIGPMNNEYLMQACFAADLRVAAWGTHGSFLDQGHTVGMMMRDARVKLHILGLTQAGHPRHPLYQRSDLQPIPWLYGPRRR